MAIVEVRDYSFAYPTEPGLAEGSSVLNDVTLSVEEGAFCVLTGPTGCGKTTLLRSLKPELTPVGKREGSIKVLGTLLVHDGEPTDAMVPRDSAALIGYVMQDPDAQIVCDTVWHEIAFGLENIGLPQDAMRRRIAEVAHFFGIEPWMQANTQTLSGGQKQLVNLAGVLALRPRLLLLDEPTAQLDPNARRLFLMMLERVNRELGITVIMATHAPEDVERMATHRLAIWGSGRNSNASCVRAGKNAAHSWACLRRLRFRPRPSPSMRAKSSSVTNARRLGCCAVSTCACGGGACTRSWAATDAASRRCSRCLRACSSPSVDASIIHCAHRKPCFHRTPKLCSCAIR